MKKMIKVFLKNIFTQKGFYICLLIAFALNIFISYVSHVLVGNNAQPSTVADQMLPLLGSGVDITQTIFITLFVCADFTDGAVKNYIARGYTRRQILTCKFIVALIGIAAFFLFEILGIFVLYGKNGLGFEAGNWLYILGSIASIIATVGLYVVVANTAEKLSTAIMINILLPMIITLVLPLLTTAFHLKVTLSSYWVSNLGTLLSKVPTTSELLQVIGISFVYLVILFEISNFIIRRKDVK